MCKIQGVLQVHSAEKPANRQSITGLSGFGNGVFGSKQARASSPPISKKDIPEYPSWPMIREATISNRSAHGPTRLGLKPSF